ncbi:MAG: CatB-related O-acetyltransferase [Planctomycetota bacterium]
MIDRFRRYLRHRQLRRQHPGATIGLWADVTDVKLAAGCLISDGAGVTTSRLGANVTVRRAARLTRATVGAHTLVGPCTELTDVTVGGYSYFAGHATVRSATFGRFCSIGRELLCGLGEHPTDRVSTSPVFYSTAPPGGVTFATRDTAVEHVPVTVGSDVWIGARVFLRDGITLGHGAIVAAGAVVVDDVPPYAIVGGTPARVIRYRFDEATVERLLATAWWAWDVSRLQAAADVLGGTAPEALPGRRLDKEAVG